MKSKEQEQWLIETRGSIEEKKYERLKETVKKLQAALQKTTTRAKRAELSLMKSRRVFAKFEEGKQVEEGE